ncbi:MAG: FAD-dependent oxidoreductase [Candidatus Odinarchaeota archaeon]|nr:FAD-dependent oxidoreductase [Candidatus Odinarchaeota archaeon]
MKEINVNVAIIGSGPAGLAAAKKLYDLGVKDIVILERDDRLGGILPQCIHPGFGLHYFGVELTGPEFIHRFIEEIKKRKINAKLNTVVMEVKPDKSVITVNPKEGLVIYHPKAIIFAVGCRERTRGAIQIPGTRPAGIFTAGTAQRLINIEGYLPGKEIVILGSGDVGLIMARRFTLEGAKVKAVVEIMKYPGGLERNVVQCLNDFNIPLLLKHTVVNIEGKDRVESVTIAEVDDKWNPIPGTEKKIKCDTLVLSVGLIPENELAENANVVLDKVTGGAIVNEWMETTVPGIFECGNALTVFDLVDYVVENAETAAEGAYRYLTSQKEECTISVTHDETIRFVVPHKVSGKHNVTFYMRVREPMENVKLVVPEIGLKVKYARARPPEMLRVKLSSKLLSRARDKKITFKMEKVEG